MVFRNGLVALALAGSLAGCGGENAKEISIYKSFKGKPVSVTHDRGGDSREAYFSIMLHDVRESYRSSTIIGGDTRPFLFEFNYQDNNKNVDRANALVEWAKTTSSDIEVIANCDISETHANRIYEIKRVIVPDFDVITLGDSQ